MDQSTQYYEENFIEYADGWSEEHLHYGFWYNDTKSHEESLINHSREIVGHLNIQDGDLILDAGCGTGGTCRYIVDNCKARVVGITLSPVLLNIAHRLTKNIPNQTNISYYIENFTNTDFNDQTFSHIFAIESICHTPSKELFINEAYRLLKPGGRLVISDFFKLQNNSNEKEGQCYREWCSGWGIPGIELKYEFESMLKNSGFTGIKFFNNTPLVKKSAKLMHLQAKERIPLYFIMHNEGKIPRSRLDHAISTYRQLECIELGIWNHGTFVANKK